MLPAAVSTPPITKVGSSPASARMEAIRLVVVVLPWVPATAMPKRKRISSASISARRMTGMPNSRARNTSGFFGSIADEVTTTEASLTFSAAWPKNSVAPLAARRSVLADGFKSEPLTA